MNVLTEMSMPLYPREYRRLVSGEDCQVVAKEAIKGLMERTMDLALQERMGRGIRPERAGKDRRNGYYERDLLTSWGWFNRIRVPRGRVTSSANVVPPYYRRRQKELDATVMANMETR
ncbi:MAG: transposase [Spirochaetales bacterium]|nr:transposase [Spirochaetales bacterium]